jgi:hypothetical protein
MNADVFSIYKRVQHPAFSLKLPFSALPFQSCTNHLLFLSREYFFYVLSWCSATFWAHSPFLWQLVVISLFSFFSREMFIIWSQVENWPCPFIYKRKNNIIMLAVLFCVSCLLYFYLFDFAGAAKNLDGGIGMDLSEKLVSNSHETVTQPPFLLQICTGPLQKNLIPATLTF